MTTSIFLRYKNRQSISYVIKQNGKQIKSETFKDLKYYKNPKGREEKSVNAHSLKVAQKRLIELKAKNNNGALDMENIAHQNDSFIEWWEQIIEERAIVNKSTAANYSSSLQKFKAYLSKENGADDIIRWKITRPLILDYKRYIELLPLASQTKRNNFMDFKVVINEGIERGKGFQSNVIPKKCNISAQNKKRVFLTTEECRKLFNTNTDGLFEANRSDYKYRYTKEFFIFSCLTGMSHRDAMNFKWEHINMNINGSWSYNYTRIKTGKEYEDIPLSQQAIEFLKEIKSKHDSEYVFPTLLYNPPESKRVKRWAKRAGIDKNLTMHCARATFASEFLKVPGNNINTLMKFMGHQNIATTMRYVPSDDKEMNRQVNNMSDLRIAPSESLVAV
jgi:integrase